MKSNYLFGLCWGKENCSKKRQIWDNWIRMRLGIVTHFFMAYSDCILSVLQRQTIWPHGTHWTKVHQNERKKIVSRINHVSLRDANLRVRASHFWDYNVQSTAQVYDWISLEIEWLHYAQWWKAANHAFINAGAHNNPSRRWFTKGFSLIKLLACRHPFMEAFPADGFRPVNTRWTWYSQLDLECINLSGVF